MRKEVRMKQARLSFRSFTAAFMLLTGAGLAVASFILNEHSIHSSVLWYVAQCVTYAASMFGVSIVVDEKLRRISAHLDKDNEK